MKKRLLLVDDDSSNLRSLTLLLEDDYEVKTAKSGNECSKILSTESFDCIISDYYMAEGDGLDVLKRTSKVVPTIIMTGHGSKEVFIEFANHHAFAVIEKPIKPQLLEGKISAALVERERLRNNDIMARVGERTSHIVHDLNNPLAIMVASISAEKETQPEESKFFSRMERLSGRFSELVFGLKAQITNEKTICKSVINVHHLLTSIAEDYKEVLLRNQIQITVSSCKECNVVSDPIIIQRVLENLISNSNDAMTSGGKIEIVAIDSTDKVKIFVRDNGPGLPNIVKDNLFKEKVTTKGEGKGTGIGLFESKKLLKLIKSDLNLTDTNSKGTEFVVELAKEL